MKKSILIMLAVMWAGAAMAQTNSAPFAASPASVGTSSAQVSSAHTRRHLEFQNQSGTATIYCTLDGSAAVGGPTAGQITLPPLSGYAWGTGLVPANAINCIATGAATPLTILE
jgi:hypothetical protein